MYRFIQIILFFIFIFNSFCLKSQDKQLRKVKNDAFKRGEKLTFRAYYHSALTGNIQAGKAELEIKNDNQVISGRSTLHIAGTGKSVGAFNWFFKVNDQYDSWIDEETIAPLLFFRRVNEGGFIINQDIFFDQKRNIILTKEKGVQKVKKTTDYIQDIISSFYFSRLYDASNLKLHDSIPCSFFLDDSVYTIKIVYEGKENVKTKAGEFRCLRLKPMVLTGNVFKEPYPMTLWISDDKNHIPVLASSGLVVGSVRLELIKFENLLNYPLALIR